MSFLNPILLAGLAAVSVPIIIHLLNRRKFQKVVWAAMRFLKVSVEQNQRRLQIEDIILLALRCLLIGLIALALARPVASSLARTLFGSQVTAVIILDNSYSMGMSDGTSTRFDKARKAAIQAIETMPAGSAVAVLLASDIANGVIPEPTFDLNLARRVIRDSTLTDRGTDLAPAINQALQTLQRRLLLRGEVYVITDGQTAGWRRMAQIQKALNDARSKIKTHVLLVADHEEQNLGVSDLEMASGLAPARQPVRFKVRVANFGKNDATGVRVALNVDADPPSDEFTIENLPAGASRDVSLFARFRTEGPHAVTARISEDRLPADDRRTMVVRALREVRVLLVDGEPGAEPRASETFFLRHALQPVPPAEWPGYFIKPVVVALPEFAGARLDDFDAVVLANVPEFSATMARQLESYVRRGGGLVIFPGGRVNPAFYNDQLARGLKLLPATFGGTRGQASQEENYFTLQEKNFEHPLVSLWNDPASGTLASARFYRAFDLVPLPGIAPATNQVSRPGSGAAVPAAVGESRTILRFADGKVAAIERDFGLGRVVMFASTGDTAWNDLPVRPSFVPLLHRTLGLLLQKRDEGLNVRAGSKFFRHVPPEWLGRDAAVTRPRSTDKTVRDTRRIEMVDGQPAVQHDQTDLAGLYEVGVTGVEPAVALRFAVQPDPAESLLDELSIEQKKALASVAGVAEWTPRFSWKDQVVKERHGSEFWLPLLVAALALAVLEMMLAQWFSRSK